MKRVAAAVLCAAAVAPGAFAVKTSTAIAEARAEAWLSVHGAPQQDDLAELKAENPQAYAIVKALLTKRSLGLLDPHHPTASFAAPPPQQSDNVMASGAAAFEKIAEESGEKRKIAPIYAEAPTSSHQNWLNWKPQQSAVDEDAMVQNVLGDVAQIRSGGGVSLRGSVAAEDDSRAGVASLAGEAQMVQPATTVAVPAMQSDSLARPATQPNTPKASMTQENSYVKGADVVESEGSYLKGLDIGGDAFAASAPAPQAATPRALVAGFSAVRNQDETDALASFSWDDGVAPQRAQSAQASLASAAAPAAPAKNSALMAWLTSSNPARKQASPPPSQAAPAGNTYLMALA